MYEQMGEIGKTIIAMMNRFGWCEIGERQKEKISSLNKRKNCSSPPFGVVHHEHDEAQAFAASRLYCFIEAQRITSIVKLWKMGWDKGKQRILIFEIIKF